MEILKLEFEHEVNQMLDRMNKTANEYKFEQIAVNGFSWVNNKWMQAMTGIDPVNKNLKKLLAAIGPIVVHRRSVLAKASRNFSITLLL